MENNNTVEQQGKTFTQEELNAIIGKRLAEQKQQYEAGLVEREQELTKREMNMKAAELLAERGLPKTLAGVLKYDTEEELVKAIETLEKARGFKKADLSEYKVWGDNRLPEFNGNLTPPDPVRDAFMERK